MNDCAAPSDIYHAMAIPRNDQAQYTNYVNTNTEEATAIDEDALNESLVFVDPDAKILCEYQEGIGAAPSDESSVSADPDAKILCEYQEVFIKPHIDRCPCKLIQHNFIKLKNTYYCCWRSEEDTKIFLGGDSAITVLTLDGSQRMCQLWADNRYVISGLAVTSEKQLICTASMNEGYDDNTLWTVNIPINLSDNTRQHTVNQLTVQDPVCVFIIDKLRYGVLCTTKQIEFYTLKNILLDHEPSAIDILKLDIEISNEDSACTTPDENIVVTSMYTCSIHIYNVMGDVLNIFNQECRWTLDNDWHRIFWDGKQHRLFLQCFDDGVVMTSENGVACVIKEGRLSCIETVDTLENVCHCVYSGQFMWCLSGENQDEVGIYGSSDSSVAQNIVEDCDPGKPIEILGRNMNSCPKALDYDKSIQTAKKPNCCWRSGDDDSIYIGGENTISMLKEDRSTNVYKLGNEQMSVISGLAVTHEHQLITVRGNRDKLNAYVVSNSHGHTDRTLMLPVNELCAKDPRWAFPITKVYYGLLCATNYIEIFTIKNILIDHNPIAYNKIRMEFKQSEFDTACATSEGNIVVSSWMNRTLYTYSITGKPMRSYSDHVGAIWRQMLWNGIAQRVHALGFNDGLVLSNDTGILYSLKNESWFKIPKSDGNKSVRETRQWVHTKERMWLLDGQSNKIQIFNETHISPDDLATNSQCLEPEELTEVHIGHIPNKLKYEDTIITTNKHHCCWRTNADDVIYLGSQNVITRLVQDIEGMREMMYKLWRENLVITSGLAVNKFRHLICCRDECGDTHMYTVLIPDNLPQDTHLQPLDKWDISNIICMFALSDFHYGVLCKTKRIVFLSLGKVLHDRNPTQKNVIYLQHDISVNDMACASSDDKICVTSSRTNSVNIYSRYGHHIRNILIRHAGHGVACHRLFVQWFNNCMVVVTQNGYLGTHEDCDSWDLICFNIDKYSGNSRKLGEIDHCVFNGNKFWIIDKTDSQIVHIYNY